MAMRLKKVEEIHEDGVVFIAETYSNGKRETIVKTQKSDKTVKVEKPIPELTETEEAILNTAINTEYLVCLAELGL